MGLPKVPKVPAIPRVCPACGTGFLAKTRQKKFCDDQVCANRRVRETGRRRKPRGPTFTVLELLDAIGDCELTISAIVKLTGVSRARLRRTIEAGVDTGALARRPDPEKPVRYLYRRALPQDG